jgi:hypothetical protein
LFWVADAGQESYDLFEERGGIGGIEEGAGAAQVDVSGEEDDEQREFLAVLWSHITPNLSQFSQLLPNITLPFLIGSILLKLHESNYHF